MLSRDEDILKAAEDWRKAGRAVALATVVETWGSAPRPVGSNLVIDHEGNIAVGGDSETPFSIQSISKVFTLTLALGKPE